MKRSRSIWFIYGLCLAVTLPSMGWLTHLAIRLDHGEAQATVLFQQEQDVREALWRMDAALSPILAEEVTRPYFVYRTYYTPPSLESSGKAPRRVASPLLTCSSRLVLLHFEIDPAGAISAPQCPPEPFLAEALAQGATEAAIAQSRERLELLRKAVSREVLLKLLPQQDLPPVDVGQLAWLAPATSSATEQPVSGPQTSVQQHQSSFNRVAPLAGQQAVAQSAQIVQGAQSAQVQETLRDQRGFETRNQVLQNLAQSERANQSFFLPTSTPPAGTLVSEGASRAFWAGEHLLMARRSKIGDNVFIQGCWLDWSQLQALLRDQVTEILPDVDFLPVLSSGDRTVSGRVLATLPVELVVPVAVPPAQRLTLIRVALVVAWICLLVAAVAPALLLAGMMRLSARQTAFVTAVTHELRTPLTTFRLYADLLADEMVAAPEQRRVYLQTLRSEADRLTHLVANVLAYARLDGGRHSARCPVQLLEFVERIQGRLAERAALAEMELVVKLNSGGSGHPPISPQSPAPPENGFLETDPLVLEQILFNLVDNAAKYAVGATDRRIHLDVERSEDQVLFRVRDHGPGMPTRKGSRLFRPFSKTAEEAAVSAPGVGLGLALCRRLAIDLGGELQHEPSNQPGATFRLTLP